MPGRLQQFQLVHQRRHQQRRRHFGINFQRSLRRLTRQRPFRQIAQSSLQVSQIVIGGRETGGLGMTAMPQ